MLAVGSGNIYHDFAIWYPEQTKRGGLRNLCFKWVFRWRSTSPLRFIFKAILFLLLALHSHGINLIRQAAATGVIDPVAMGVIYNKN